MAENNLTVSSKGASRAFSIGTVLLLIGLLYFLSVRTTSAFALFGFSPDSCWLLKLGKIILQQKSIPTSDPFTFTQSLGGAPPLVIYQWLSEVLFFLGLYLLKPEGLLAIASAITVASFLLLPLRACIRANVDPLWLVVTVIVLSWISNTRTFLRPELFTYLFTALYLTLLQRFRLQTGQEVGTDCRIQWGIVTALTVLMLFWVNMHTGFVAGVLILATYSFFLLINDWQTLRRITAKSKTILLSFLLSCLDTLANPYGQRLWCYLPHLFFAPINAQITETKALSINFVGAAPFLALLILCFGALVFVTWTKLKRNRDSGLTFDHLLSLFIVLIASCIGFCWRREIALSGLIVLFETVNFCHSFGRSSGSMHNLVALASFLKTKWSYLVLDAVILFMLVPGSIFLAKYEGISITIPCLSLDFRPPFEALSSFAKVYSTGRIFAVARIADMIELYMPPNSSLFMDTRLDRYSDVVLKDYHSLICAEKGWRQLLDRYRIEWLLIIPENPLYSAIQDDKGWDLVERDRFSAIFRRAR
jgi:hypothetical protein